MKIVDVAEVCHEINRAFCASIGDNTQLPWNEAPGWAQLSAIAGVNFHLAHPHALPSASHESWMLHKVQSGWVVGPVKDEARKEHPCIVPYNELPVEQQSKDFLFKQVVHSLEKFIEL